MKGFMQGPQTIFTKWSVPGKSDVLGDGCCRCPQHCLWPTQPQKWEKETRITLMEPEIMMSEEHKYSWNLNQKVITWTHKQQCSRKRDSWKNFVSVALLRPIYMPGKRTGNISGHLLAQYTPNDFSWCWIIFCLTPDPPKQTYLMFPSK